MNQPAQNLEKVLMRAISLGFVFWSIAFIYRSSFIAIDGKRYFCLFDDALISMRYAWNFSHGNGLVWNPGDYVAGYSNLLMTLFMSPATLLGDKSTAALWIQISGIGFMLGIAHLTLMISDYVIQPERPEHRTLIRIISFSGPLTYYPLAYWSLLGMETGLLTVLLLAGILCSFRYVERKKPIFLWGVAICLGLASLTRHDSSLFSVLVWLYLIWEIWSFPARGRCFGQVALAIGLFLMFITGQLAFQYLYYGDWLPNTYTLKLTGMPVFIRIQDGFNFIIPFFLVTSIPLVLSVLGLCIQFGKQRLLLCLIAFSAIGYEVYVGGDPWVYWRIPSPTMPLVLILFLNTVYMRICSSLDSPPPDALHSPIFSKKYMIEVLVPVLICVGWICANVSFLPEMLLWKRPYHTEDQQKFVNVAIALNELTTNQATVGVFWAGSVPYFTGRPAIDFLGKSDRYIAQLPPDLSGASGWSNMISTPGHNKYDLDYSIKKLEPTYVQVFHWGRQSLIQWSRTRYVTVRYKGVHLCLRKNSPFVNWDKVMAHGAIVAEGSFIL